MTTITITTDVDVDIEEFCDEDLIDECERRGLMFSDGNEFGNALFLALKLGDKDKVYELCRAHVQESRGCVL